MSYDLQLSDKYLDFLRHDAPVEFLEGTTAAGKTTVGAVKFLFKCAENKNKIHVIAGLDLGTIEKNLIIPDLGILDIFGDHIQYNPSGRGSTSLPHLLYNSPYGEKIIYTLGYDNKVRWKKALGGQYGCLLIDEINVADMEFVREASMRCDYMMGTLNPDDPNLPIYDEYINHARPVEKYIDDVPNEILKELNQEEKEGWTHWFFTFLDNLGLSEEKIAQIKTNVPIGTKLHKNKILGLRGRATGLVFPNFRDSVNIVDDINKWQELNKTKFIRFSCGVDTAYSSQSPDTIAFIFQGITDKGHLVVLEEAVYNNKLIEQPLAPSNVTILLVDFLERCRKKWGLARDVFIDSADQATLTELKKFKREKPCVYNFLNSYKRDPVIDRIHHMQDWIGTEFNEPVYIVSSACKEHLRELGAYSWKDDRYEPEDANDHTINASQYGYTPFKNIIGRR